MKQESGSTKRGEHYHKNGTDVIGFAKKQFPKEEVRGFLRINILKYVVRYDRKGGLLDLKKAMDYLDLLTELEAEEDAFERIPRDFTANRPRS